MKIAYACIHFNKTGGIERVVSEIALRIAPRHEVHVFSATRDDLPGTPITFHTVPMDIRKPTFLMWIDYFFRCGHELRKHSFDIVHAHNPVFAKIDIMTAHSVHKVGVDLLLKNETSLFRKAVLWAKLGYPLIMPVAAYNYRPGRYRRIIAVSAGLKREIEQTFGVPREDIEVIHNGVNGVEFNSANRRLFRETVRRRYGISENDRLTIFAGNEFKRKGVEYLIRALRHVVTPGVKALIVGEPVEKPPRAYYEAVARECGVEDRIIFTGRTKNIKELLAAADIFVFPTVYEAFAMVTLEAAASGLPLLMTRVNGAEELIEEGSNGYFIAREPRDIAEKIDAICADSAFIEAGQRASMSAKRFAWETIVARTEELYKEIAAGKR